MPARFGLRLRHPRLSQLRIGEGHPRYRIPIHLRALAEQRIPDDDARVIVGGMGERRPAGHVAHGIDPPVAGLERPVHAQRVADATQPSPLHVQFLRIGAAPGRDQKMAAGDGLLAAGATDDGGNLSAARLHAHDLDT